MTLGDKLRSLRAIEGSLRGFGRPMTQAELVEAMREELGRGLSQAYVSQLESGARPHMTNVARALGLERSHLYKKCQQLGIDLQSLRKPE